MTIRCAWCQKLLGEKCGKCGSADVRKEYSFAHGVDYWRCFGCRSTWLPGAEDTSHGICQPACAEGIKALGIGTLFPEPVADATGDSSEQGSGQDKIEAGETPALPGGESEGE